MNDAGRVANEVEIEQVVDAGFDWRTGFPLLASLVQVPLRSEQSLKPSLFEKYAAMPHVIYFLGGRLRKYSS